MAREQQIYPILNTNYEEGCGFFIDHHFFTSGHIIAKAENPYIVVNEIRVSLSNPIFYQCDEYDVNGYDLAIFDIPSCYSKLELFEDAIIPDMELKSVSFKNLGRELVETEVITQEQDGNYFSGISQANLKSGSSGSPVLLENKVVGVMTKGNNNDLDEPKIASLPLNFCMFLSATAIKNIL